MCYLDQDPARRGEIEAEGAALMDRRGARLAVFGQLVIESPHGLFALQMKADMEAAALAQHQQKAGFVTQDGQTVLAEGAFMGEAEITFEKSSGFRDIGNGKIEMVEAHGLFLSKKARPHATLKVVGIPPSRDAERAPRLAAGPAPRGGYRFSLAGATGLTCPVQGPFSTPPL